MSQSTIVQSLTMFLVTQIRDQSNLHHSILKIMIFWLTLSIILFCLMFALSRCDQDQG